MSEQKKSETKQRTRTPSKLAPETIAVRRISRVLDELEEPSRERVVGAIKSLYFGPGGREQA